MQALPYKITKENARFFGYLLEGETVIFKCDLCNYTHPRLAIIAVHRRWAHKKRESRRRKRLMQKLRAARRPSDPDQREHVSPDGNKRNDDGVTQWKPQC